MRSTPRSFVSPRAYRDRWRRVHPAPRNVSWWGDDETVKSEIVTSTVRNAPPWSTRGDHERADATRARRRAAHRAAGMPAARGGCAKPRTLPTNPPHLAAVPTGRPRLEFECAIADPLRHPPRRPIPEQAHRQERAQGMEEPPRRRRGGYRARRVAGPNLRLARRPGGPGAQQGAAGPIALRPGDRGEGVEGKVRGRRVRDGRCELGVHHGHGSQRRRRRRRRDADDARDTRGKE